MSCRHVLGFPCWTVTPDRGGERDAVYLHGGAYVAGITKQHWSLIGALADAGVHVEVPLYGLAPQHTHRQAYPLLLQVWRELLDAVPGRTTSLVGDSAGGGLALGLAQELVRVGLPQPARLVLIAPWLDLTLSNPQVRRVAPSDPWLSPDGLVEMGTAWAGGDDPTLPQLSPVNGSLTGLAPIHVWAGTRDVLQPDIARLQEQAESQGHPLDVVACRGAVHVYPLTPTPEGRAAARQVVGVVAGSPWY